MILNEFMELLILLDQIYAAPELQRNFFDKFKEPFIFVLAKSCDSKGKFYLSIIFDNLGHLDPHQTKEFINLKVFCTLF